MAENSKIEWCDNTMNFWIGCTKVSPACDHCYAEAWATRYGKPHLWDGERQQTTLSNRYKAHKWNKEAAALGIRYRVFTNSLADFFDNQVPSQWRREAWHTIEQTPHLDWLILTKRPQNIAKMLPDPETGVKPWGDGWNNVWLGTTAENQQEADRRIPHLLDVPAAVRFVSAEPLLGPVDFRAWMSNCYECGASCGLRLPTFPSVERCTECEEECGPDTEPVISEGCPKCGGELEPVCPDCGHYMVYQHPDTPNLDWIIVGGESGPGARPMHPDWTRSIRDQCAAAGTAFFMKQMHGVRKPLPPIPDDLKIRQMPTGAK